MTLPPPCATPTQPLAVVGCKLAPQSPLNPQPPITRLADPPLGYKSLGREPLAPSIARRHLGGRPQHTRAKREEGEEEEEGEDVRARSTAADQAGADDTALPPELHDHNSSLRRYPLALNNDGEPYAAETSS